MGELGLGPGQQIIGGIKEVQLHMYNIYKIGRKTYPKNLHMTMRERKREDGGRKKERRRANCKRLVLLEKPNVSCLMPRIPLASGLMGEINTSPLSCIKRKNRFSGFAFVSFQSNWFYSFNIPDSPIQFSLQTQSCDLVRFIIDLVILKVRAAIWVSLFNLFDFLVICFVF